MENDKFNIWDHHIKVNFEKKRKRISIICLVCCFLVVALVGCGSSEELTDGTESSIANYELTEDNSYLVDNPSQEYIIERLQTVDGISDIECATEDNDPNELLNDETGGTAAVFFAYDKVDQSQFSETERLSIGTDGGGCIEVFNSQDSAEKRAKKLSKFSISGSHKVLGTVIIRTSSKLSEDEQTELEALICSALLEDSSATEIADESTTTSQEYEEEEVISSIEEDTEAEIGIRDESITGHGVSDSGWDEPQYVGYIGYVVLRNDSELKKSDTFTETPWTVPVYEQDKQFYNEVDTIEHKTEVLVLSQNLSHEGHGFYSGYLEVESLETGTQYIIDVNNFITKPYWTYDDLEEAAAVGDYIAEYNQASDYYPVTKSNEKADLDDGILVLVVGKTGTYGGDGPDNDTNQIEAIVFNQWTYGYGGESVFFNSSDLTLIY